jgi:hypothetical protein
MARKYEPLADHLDVQSATELTMSFTEVAAVVGPLPPSAYKHQAWWSNSLSHPEAKDGWMAAGWEVASFDLAREVVTFRRNLNYTPWERSVTLSPKGRPMSLNTSLRKQLAQNLRAGNAHLSFEDAVAQFPEAHINARPENVEYSFWHLVEHLRLTQADILRYVTDPAYQEMAWPRDYWPARDAGASKAEWDASIQGFLEDREALAAMVEDEGNDLLMPAPSHAEHTLLREVLIIIDHNAYHVGELAILRQIANIWGTEHEE